MGKESNTILYGPLGHSQLPALWVPISSLLKRGGLKRRLWVGPSEGLEAARQALTPSDGQGLIQNTTQVFVSLALANELIL